ncbi:MAG: hypothetical protein N2606_02395 [Candidatus Omnitrophica bacterium]|nr:hypothetical protein [Candidatus Omnitrophota bacterium]
MRRGNVYLLVMIFLLIVFVSFSFSAAKSTAESKKLENIQRESQQETYFKHYHGRHKMGSYTKGFDCKKIVATSDGGVVIWWGSKLIKFDKDLKKVGEVELEIPCPLKAYWHTKKDKEKTETAGDEIDPHTIDPYHHPPRIKK